MSVQLLLPIVSDTALGESFVRNRKATRCFSIQNRRYLGNKHKLLDFLEEIVGENCGNYSSFCDIFAGTGVVGEKFNKKGVKIISNDILESNYRPLLAWLMTTDFNRDRIGDLIEQLNSLDVDEDNYVSDNFGNVYFTVENARKIGAIRERIKHLRITPSEYNLLITSLIYAMDRVANTCGHYDAFRKKMDTKNRINLLIPDIKLENNLLNEVYKEDANELIRRIETDILYVDPPYNSRQYCDTYHVLENIADWKKPPVFGKARKMKRDHLKSKYCLKSATSAFNDLIQNARCKHILVSYNNTGEKKDARSNARILDTEIADILSRKGKVSVFEKNYKAFTTGLSETNGHTERVFYCRVT